MNKMQQRLESLYEDIGVKLGKYYDISEAMDAVGKEDSDINQEAQDEILSSTGKIAHPPEDVLDELEEASI
jgi:hypothetical protein